MFAFIFQRGRFWMLILLSLISNAALGQTNNMLKLASAGFSEGQPIPEKYTCKGRNFSPSLNWNAGPTGTKAYAVTCVDPDAPAGTWTHWVIYNLPETVTELPENVSKVEAPPSGGRQTINSFKKIGYDGPCPPKGNAHHYIFTVYALDNELSPKPKATRNDFENEIKGHVLAQGQLMGTFQSK
jgi:Raf kinase inhibitor-like YbhB/YbcL family protein